MTDQSPACAAGDHGTCFHVANPMAKRREWRGCACTCHVATF